MKKGLKITGIIIASILAVILTAGLIIPVVFRERIREKVETAINGMVDAKVTFSDYKLSLIRSFPNAAFTLSDLNIAGTGSFESDTLASIESFRLVFNLMSLFGDKGYEIKSVIVDNPDINTIILEDGTANWDIMKETPEDAAGETTETLDATPLKVALNRFTLRGGRLSYSDRESDMAALLEEMDLAFSGNMSGSRTGLVLELTAGKTDFTMDNIAYLTDARVSFQADIDALLDSMMFTLKDNLLKINDIAIDLSGIISMPADDIDLDLVFSTRDNSFKSLLSLVPALYMKDFEGLKASGTFALEGAVKGRYSSADSTMPDITAILEVSDGVISYPDLPEKITAIYINGKVQTDGKDMDNTVTEVSRFHFELAGNPFDMSLRLATPMSDPLIEASASGKIDLAKLQQAIPLDSVTMNGLVDVSLDIAGRMSMLENKMYDQFEAAGEMKLSDMTVAMVGMPSLKISDAGFKFTPAYAELTGLAATMGEKSDFTLSGRLENYIPYLFADGTIKGSLSMKSKMVDLNEILDIMPSDTTENDTTALSVIHIPENIDFAFDAAVDRLTYGKLSAEDVKGEILVRDGILILKETGMKALGGALMLNASYDTRDTVKPLVNAAMLVSAVNIRQAFDAFNTVQQLVPAAAGLGGNVTVKMDFRSQLNSSVMPVISTISGHGEFSSESVQILESKSFDMMKSVLKMNQAYTNTVRDLKATFIINDGRLFVKPFDTRLGNIKLNVSGDQGLDRTINYLVKTEIPSADMGESAAALMGTFSSQLAALGVNIAPPEIIKVNLKIGGTFTKPVITPVFAGGTGGLGDAAGQGAAAAVNAVTTAVKEEVTEKINEAAREQADRILAEATEKADMLRKEAESSAVTIRQEADVQGKKLIKEAEAKGPIAVLAAKKAADALNKEADKRATQLVTEANSKADKMLEEARLKADELLK